MAAPRRGRLCQPAAQPVRWSARELCRAAGRVRTAVRERGRCRDPEREVARLRRRARPPRDRTRRRRAGRGRDRRRRPARAVQRLEPAGDRDLPWRTDRHQRQVRPGRERRVDARHGARLSDGRHPRRAGRARIRIADDRAPGRRRLRHRDRRAGRRCQGRRLRPRLRLHRQAPVRRPQHSGAAGAAQHLLRPERAERRALSRPRPRARAGDRREPGRCARRGRRIGRPEPLRGRRSARPRGAGRVHLGRPCGAAAPAARRAQLRLVRDPELGSPWPARSSRFRYAGTTIKPCIARRPGPASVPPSPSGARPDLRRGCDDVDRREKSPADPGRPRSADGPAAAPLLDADRRRLRVRRARHQADAPDGRRPRALQGPERHLRADRPAVWRIAAPTSRTAWSRASVCAATTTAGASTRPANACSSRSRTPAFRSTGRARAPASSPIRSRPWAAWSGPTWARCPRPNCPTGKLSRGTTAMPRSSSAKCPATGSRRRRTRSIRCISSGCTRTGASGCAPTTRRSGRPT